MAKFKNKYRIESNRWQYWDYSAPGRYFITIVIQHRKCILGRVVNGKMELSPFGEMVKTEIEKIPQYHPRALVDEWVIMPNHIHLLIELGAYDYDNGVTVVEKIHEFSLPSHVPSPAPPPIPPGDDAIKQYRKMRRKMLIPKIIGRLQMQSSKQINIRQNTPGRKNWQPNYHDHVIRNQASYLRIKNYIIKNPEKWNEDTFNAL
ncbi:MAG: transposase [Lewinellaceae bacterium]|nr:transposase [Lewinellaceae bacterium]